MPVKPTYPGVYIEEIPSGVRTIVGVSTSVAAFVDSFQRGPLNEAVQVFNFGEFEAEFGGLDADSEASYGVQQFFQNGGAEAWIVRVATSGDANPANNALASSDTLQDTPGGNDVLLVSAGRRIRGESAENPGRWGDALHVEIDYDTSDPATLFNLTVREIVTQGGRRIVLRTETHRNLSMTVGAANNAIEKVNEGSRLVQLSRSTTASVAGSTRATDRLKVLSGLLVA
jgi:phage tail sheath protein FI